MKTKTMTYLSRTRDSNSNYGLLLKFNVMFCNNLLKYIYYILYVYTVQGNIYIYIYIYIYISVY